MLHHRPPPPQGFGRFEWDDGQVYEGQWLHDRQHGEGRWFYCDGELDMPGTKHASYVGGWKDGKMSGKGRFEFWNGDVYEGEYADGKRHGEGIYTFGATGESHAATFERGETVTRPGQARTKALGIRSASTVTRLLSGLARTGSGRRLFGNGRSDGDDGQ